MTDAENRALFVRGMARSTVWIRQNLDGQWEAINWNGIVVAFSKYRLDIEKEVKRLSSDPVNNIWAYSVIVSPVKRRRHYNKPSRRA